MREGNKYSKKTLSNILLKCKERSSIQEADFSDLRLQSVKRKYLSETLADDIFVFSILFIYQILENTQGSVKLDLTVICGRGFQLFKCLKLI